MQVRQGLGLGEAPLPQGAGDPEPFDLVALGLDDLGDDEPDPSLFGYALDRLIQGLKTSP